MFSVQAVAARLSNINCRHLCPNVHPYIHPSIHAYVQVGDLESRLRRAPHNPGHLAAFKLEEMTRQVAERDAKIRDLESLVRAVGTHSHARPALEGYQEDQRTIADQREQIQRLQSKLARASNDPTGKRTELYSSMDTLTSRAARERGDMLNKQADRNSMILQQDNIVKTEQIAVLMDDLRNNRRVMVEQNEEISRLAYVNERLKKLENEKHGAHGSHASDARAFVMMREQVGEAEVSAPHNIQARFQSQPPSESEFRVVFLGFRKPPGHR